MVDAIKADLPRNVALGYYLFLESEKYRHWEDIQMIQKRQEGIVEKYSFSFAEIKVLMEWSEDFRKIE